MANLRSNADQSWPLIAHLKAACFDFACLLYSGMPFFTCIILSHDKPSHVGEAIASVVNQSFPDWEAIIFDSGVLHDQGFFQTLPTMDDPRLRLVRSWETEALRRTKTIASWCFNECFRKKLVRGRYVIYLCDDDLFYPNAFAAFHSYVNDHPETLAMYGSVDMTVINAHGEKFFLKELIADQARGQCCLGPPIDRHVDSLQLCHHVDILEQFPNDEYWPEDRSVTRHADGLFMEAIGRLVPLQPVPVKVGENRKVPSSLNDGGDRLGLLEQICRVQEENRQLQRLLAEKQEELEEENRQLQGVLAVKLGLEEEARRLHRLLALKQELPLRYKIADCLNNFVKGSPPLHQFGRRLLRSWMV